MKHWLPPAVILAAILAFCIWDAREMRQETSLWQIQLEKADALAVAEDWESALQTVEDSYRDWLSRQLYVHLVSQREVADDAEAMYHRAIAFAKTEEISEFRAELSDLRDQMRVLSDMESISIRSIF